MECWLCGKEIGERWSVKLHKRKHSIGDYCSKKCAVDDSWGPKYRKSKPVRVQKEKL